MKGNKIMGLMFLILILSSISVNAESSNNLNTTIYHYDSGGSRLDYTIDSNNNSFYYVYDRNGNLKRKIASTGYTVFTSSSIEGWEPYKLRDNNSATVWSSVNRGNEGDMEWVAADLGKSGIVGGVELTPRGKLSFPVNFKIQSSDDAVAWTDLPGQTYSNFVNDGSTHSFQFEAPVIARYIRVYATKLGRDDNGQFYFQLAEIKIKPSTVATSSTTGGWPASRLVDQNATTTWSSIARYPAESTEWIVLDSGSIQMIGGVELYPRGTLGFPVDFRIQSSSDAKSWTDIPGQAYRGYINNGSVQTFNFDAPVIDRYVRVYATKLGTDDNGGYYFQLAEIKVNLSTVAVSSEINGWPASRLVDQNATTTWSSVARYPAESTEWIIVDSGSIQMIGGIHLYPRGTLGFPVDFKIQSSSDAKTWTDIPGQSYTGYVNNGSVQTFNFDAPVIDRFIRVYATKLGTDDNGGYYFQLAEIKVKLSTVSVSSALNGWSASRLVDQNTSTMWSSIARYPSTSTEWVAVDSGMLQKIAGIQLIPRATLGFPVDFKIQSSIDGKVWTDVKGQSYTGYVNNGSIKTFTFNAPILARYVRVYATKLGTDDNGGFYFQLSEFGINKS